MISLQCARSEIVGDLYVRDADYIYHREVAEEMRPHMHGVAVFGTDDESDEVQLDMMVKVDSENNVIDMSKELTDYEYYFNSQAYVEAAHLDDIFRAADTIIQERGNRDVHVEEALVRYAKDGGEVKFVDVGPPKWVEIDNGEELEIARKMVARDTAGFIL